MSDEDEWKLSFEKSQTSLVESMRPAVLSINQRTTRNATAKC